MTLLTTFDSVTPSNLPTGGDGYLAYSNGHYANLDAVQTRFPNVPIKSISVFGTDWVALASDIADCENGDYTPADAAQWAQMKKATSPVRPTIYCNTSTYGDVANALAALRLQFAVDVDWLEAHYDNLPELSTYPGAIGKQYLTTPGYDVSVVLSTWLSPPHPTPWLRSPLLLQMRGTYD